MRGFKNKNFTLSAIYEGQTYTYTESNVTFENGKYYEITAKLTEFDLSRNAFRFDDRLVKHGWRRRAECYVFNALSELDEPGEWVLDREARRLYVKPLEGVGEMPIYALVPTIV